MATYDEAETAEATVGLAMTWVASENAAGIESGSLLEGFESWMAAEQERVYVLCLRMLKNRDDADSATQDTFLKAHRALAGPRPRRLDDPARWLTRIAVNTCLDVLRSRRWHFWNRRAGQEESQAALEAAAACQASPEASLFRRQVAERLAGAMNRLSLRQRAVFVLRHDEDRSFEEIADLLGLDVGTVKSHMARAIRKLKTELRDLYDRPTLER